MSCARASWRREASWRSILAWPPHQPQKIHKQHLQAIPKKPTNSRHTQFILNAMLQDTPVDANLPEYSMLDRYIETVSAGTGFSSGTVFSGIGSTFTAENLFHCAILRRRPHCGVRRINHAYAIEKWPESQNELRVLPHGPKILYGDINQFWVPPLQRFIKNMMGKPSRAVFDIMKPIVLDGKSVTRWGFDLISQKQVALPCVDQLEGGTECIDFSVRGSNAGQDGRSCLPWLCFIALRILIQEPHFITENVKQSIVAVYKDFLFHLYHIDLEDSKVSAHQLRHSREDIV